MNLKVHYYRLPRPVISKQTLKIMKLIAVILFAACLQLSARGYSQITLSETNTPLQKVFQEIQQQSGYDFVSTYETLKEAGNVTVNVRNVSLQKALQECLKGKSLTYVIIGKTVVVQPKEKDYYNASTNLIALEPLPPPPVEIHGRVVNQQGEPIQNVSVLISGTTIGTTTNNEGRFTLTASDDKSIKLEISSVGYQRKTVNVGKQTEVNVVLELAVSGLSDVVVIGYGTIKKKDLTGSVSSVQGEELTKKSAINVSQLLQGTTPGLMVTRSGGSAADASAQIRIRGITTTGDSNPLIIVDGIPSTSLDWINPNDIENISILKDAASAAIYGSKAAAGVIIVTTKKAKPGKFNMTYEYQHTIEQPTRVAEYADVVDYMNVLNEITWNDNGNIVGGNFPTFSKELIENYNNLHIENPDQYPATDWTSLMLNKSATSEKHMISISAGTKNISTFISLNYDKTNALYDGRNYDRITLRANNDIKINKFFSMELNLNSLYSINNNPRLNVSPGPIAGTIYAAKWQDGRVAGGKTGDNPYAMFKYGGNDEKKSNVFGGKMQLNYMPLDNLKFSAVLSPELQNIKDKFFRKKITYTAYDDPSNVIGNIIDPDVTVSNETSLEEGREDRLSTTVQFLANYTNSFRNMHNIGLLMGYEANNIFDEILSASRDRYSLTNFPYLDIGNSNYQFNNGSAYEYASRSFFGRLIYDYKNKYLFQSNLRYDGSSRFAKDYRWGLFPSFSAGWKITEEPFMKNIEKLSFLKLRVSWGALGNERIGNYPYQSTLGFGSALLYQGNNVIAAQTVGLSQYAIEDITWETTKVLDVGIDANFFNNQLRITADYYKKTTSGMLLALEIPNYMGVSNPFQNAGKMNTKGWDLSMGWHDRIGDFEYSANMNLSDFRSVMGNLSGTEFLGSKVKFEGSEFNEWYGYKSEGLFQTKDEVKNSPVLNSRIGPGDIKFTDISGPDGKPDGKISPEYDRVLLGGSLPRYLYGGNINVKYKNLDFGLVFQGVGKQNSLVSATMIQPVLGNRPSLEVSQIIMGNYWSKYNTDEQNQSSKYPKIGTVASANNGQFSDFWLFNGAYFRLKNINLGYTIPTNVVSKWKLNGIRFNVNISDFFSIDGYPKGWDPETTSNYWITRAFTLGVSVKF